MTRYLIEGKFEEGGFLEEIVGGTVVAEVTNYGLVEG